MKEWKSGTRKTTRNYQRLYDKLALGHDVRHRCLGQLDEHERDLRQDELAKPASRPGQQQQSARAGNVEDEIPGHVMTEAVLRR